MITTLKKFEYFSTAADVIKKFKLDTPSLLKKFKKDYGINYNNIIIGKENFEEDDLLTWFIENSDLLEIGEFFIIASSSDEWSLAIYEVHASSTKELHHFHNREQLRFTLT